MYSRVRKELGLSVKEFAQLTGASIHEVENWEAGIGGPDGETARFISDVDMKIRVYKKIRDAAGSMGFSDKYTELLDDIRRQFEDHRPEKLANLDVDEVLINHLSFSIADYFSEHDVGETEISKVDLAKHIYEHIKFLF